MNVIKANIISDDEKTRVFEDEFGNEESTISPNVIGGSFKEHKKEKIYINSAQNADIRELCIQKQNNVSATKFDVNGVIKKQKLHDSMSCVTCNSYITKRVTSYGRVISTEPKTARFHEESVINEQEIHDFCCSSCNSYIAKRIILHRKDISPDVKAISPQSGHLIVPMPVVIERHPLEAPTPEVSRLDIIKAVVYGGLVQSITSLSVVVSAAGGDASTLNIVALALANVLGGLIVLAHSLRALKQEQNTEHYEQQLGRPGHFLLHATISIISYVVFGLMSPIIYGFSFYKSDNKYLKLAALAAASLVCITLLSTGKAYVQRPPKAYMKTVFSYIGLGVMVAGPGYIAGDLANMLLKKFEVFDSSSSGSMSVIQSQASRGTWSSY